MWWNQTWILSALKTHVHNQVILDQGTWKLRLWEVCVLSKVNRSWGLWSQSTCTLGAGILCVSHLRWNKVALRIASKADIVHYILLHLFLTGSTVATVLGSTVFPRFLLFQVFCIRAYCTEAHSHSRTHKRTLEYGSPVLMFYWVKDAINSLVLTVFKNFIHMISYN